MKSFISRYNPISAESWNTATEAVAKAISSLNQRIILAVASLFVLLGVVFCIYRACRSQSRSLPQVPPSTTKRLSFDRNFFAKGVHVHADRVFFTQRLDKPESYWYHKLEDQEQALYSPFYSLFVPGSPESKIVLGNVRPRISIASKALKEAETPNIKEIGSYHGVAHAVLMARIMNYRDIRIGNALIDENRRFVLIDYEFHSFPPRLFETDEEVAIMRNNYFSEFLRDPITPFSHFFLHQDERIETAQSSYESELAFSNDPKFKSEMVDAMLIFLAFPINFLEETIQAREHLLSPLIGDRSRWEDMQSHFASCKAGLVGALKENDDYLNLVREKLAENPIAMIACSLGKSRIMKELCRENLPKEIATNLETLRALLS